MRILALIMVMAFTVGCSSTGEHKQKFIEGAKTCNTICMNNPEVGEYSQKLGGGIPLMFMGKMETKCNCNRSQ